MPSENSLHSGAAGHPLIHSIHRWGDGGTAGRELGECCSEQQTKQLLSGITLPFGLQFLFLAHLLNLKKVQMCTSTLPP